MTRRLRLLTWLLPSFFSAFPAAAQSSPTATLVIAVAGDPASPVPTLWRNDQGNREVSDLLFLRLADLGPGLSTIDEKSFVPRLARRWERRDALTLVFELDARARWHDGTPVTARDVVFALDRARNPVLSPQTATLLRRIRSVTADGDRRVIVRFSESYAEQLYDATYHAPPLPSHLLEKIPPESLATSAFVSRPIGNGPYQFVQRSPGQQMELRANDQFFLGRPGIRRVVFLSARDPEARANLLLAGEVDAIDNIYSLPNWSRLEGLPAYQYYPMPGSALLYADFNQRDPADTARPHPLFTDPVVRRALVMALDRAEMVRSVYGPLARVPDGPLSALLNRSVDAPPVVKPDTAAARRLLKSRGFEDHDADGVLDRDGRPLAFRLLIPSVVAARVALGTQMQEAWRRVGIKVDLDVLDRNEFIERRNAGRFDLEINGASQDPTPSGLTQSWTCAGIGGSNVAHYCDPMVDSLLARAALGRRGQAERLYRDAVRRIADDVPAIFLAAPVFGTPVHRRYTNVVVRPESTWSLVWQWTLRPGQEIDRDRP
jgi:peptide/nickel transport system substrate-binding protein